jgi:hypothetical protein
MVRRAFQSGFGGQIERGDVADIFDEVDEELRADRAQALLKRYGGVVVAIALLIVGAVAGWQAWRWWQNKQNVAVATEYLNATRIADAAGPAKDARGKEAMAALGKVASSAPEGYRTLARLRAAALQADGGNAQAAAALWDQVAADGAADPLLRDFASLMWVNHAIDTGDPAVIEARLKPLASPENPWHALAREAQALLYMRQGKNDQARETLRPLSQDVTAPEGIRARANILLTRLDA